MPPEIPPAQEPPLFVALRRADDRTEAGESADGDVAVQLSFDENGAYLQITDSKGRPRDVGHRASQGALRDLLKAIAQIRRRQEDLVGVGDQFRADLPASP